MVTLPRGDLSSGVAWRGVAAWGVAWRRGGRAGGRAGARSCLLCVWWRQRKVESVCDRLSVCKEGVYR